jgi:ornithine--oxo-acid transaminase
LLRNGIIAKPTQKTTIRFAPPLVINQTEMQEALELIKKAWKELA